MNELRKNRWGRQVALLATTAAFAVGMAAAGGTATAAPVGTTYPVTANIPLDSFAFGVAVDPTTNILYATSGFDSGGTSVIDGATNTITKTITAGTGNQPLGVAADPTTHTIYVAQNSGNAGADTVQVIDGVTNTATKSIAIDGSAFGVAVDPTTHTVYATTGNFDKPSTISVIDATTDTVTNTVEVGNDPRAVAVDPTTHTVYVVNANDGTMSVIDGATNTVTATVGVGAFPASVAVDPTTHTVYVGNQPDATVSVIDGTTNTVTSTIDTGMATSPSGGYIAPSGIAVDPATRTVYVARSGIGNKPPAITDGSVLVINGADNTVTAKVQANAAGSSDVAVNTATHTVYATPANDGPISVITPTDPTSKTSYGIAGTSTAPGGTPESFDGALLTATVGPTGFSDGELTLEPLRFQGTLFGFLPAAVNARVLPTSPVTGTVDGSTTTVTSSSRLVIDQITILGLPLITPGANCQASTPSTVTLTGDSNVLTEGGNLTGGTYTPAQFSGCGLLAPFLEPLINNAVAGKDNAISVTLTAPNARA